MTTPEPFPTEHAVLVEDAAARILRTPHGDLVGLLVYGPSNHDGSPQTIPLVLGIDGVAGLVAELVGLCGAAGVEAQLAEELAELGVSPSGV